jgi:hypothetical protein
MKKRRPSHEVIADLFAETTITAGLEGDCFSRKTYA